MLKETKGVPTHGVEVRNVSKQIKKKAVLNHVTASFPAASITGLQGPNGSGKTMLLRAIAGLISLQEGEIIVNGKQVSDGNAFSESMGFLIEPFTLWDEFTGLENLELLDSISKVRDAAAPRQALLRVGLDLDDQRLLKSYSLGMRQRLSIAQAIMHQPQLLLLDEPTNALDDDGKALMEAILFEERDRGATIIVISHDLEELDRISSQRYRMSEGRIYEVNES